LGKKRPDHIALRWGALLVVRGDDGVCLLAAELPGDLAPWCAAQGLAALPAAPGEGIELRTDEDGGRRLWHMIDLRLVEDGTHASPPFGGGTVLSQVVQERQ